MGKKSVAGFMKTIKIVVLVAVLAVAFPMKQAWAFSYSYITYPKSNVGVAAPEIGMTLMEISETLTPSSYTMTLDGQSVAVKYDNMKRSFSYKPASGLSEGQHHVNVMIQYDGYNPLIKEWDFTVIPDAIQLMPEVTFEQKIGLKVVNDYRQLHGLKQLTYNNALNLAAMKHAQYLKLNSIASRSDFSLHDESLADKGYIGAKLNDRANYVGYSRGMMEDVAYTFLGVVDAIDNLYDAPYHRVPFLDPLVDEIGIYSDGNYTVLEFGYDDEAQNDLIVSPADGDAYVPVQFDGHETPDPIRLHTNVAYPIGYPITLHVFGNAYTSLHVDSAEIKNASTGKPIDIKINSWPEDNHLNGDAFILPVKPFMPDTEYKVSVKLTAQMSGGGAKTFAREWTFRTEPNALIGKTKLHVDPTGYIAAKAGTQLKHSVRFGLNEPTYQLDGINLQLKRKPLLSDNRSYLYIRDLAAALGATVDWNSKEQAAVYTKGDRTVKFYTVKQTFEVNGLEQKTDTPAKLVDEGYTMIPVKLLAQTLGADVTYDGGTNSVKITY